MQTLSAPWRKSSHSGTNGGQCVETGCAPGAVLVRDTVNREGYTLSVPAGAWTTFITTVK
jgi:hypothetical protein